MVMRNRHEGGSAGWWDDLPPKIRARFGEPPPAEEETGEHPTIAPAPPAQRSSIEWIHDLSRLAVLFLAVAVANVVFLLIALAYLDGRAGPAMLMPNR